MQPFAQQQRGLIAHGSALPFGQLDQRVTFVLLSEVDPVHALPFTSQQ